MIIGLTKLVDGKIMPSARTMVFVNPSSGVVPSSSARYPPTGSIFAQSMLPSLRFTFGKTPATAKVINKSPKDQTDDCCDRSSPAEVRDGQSDGRPESDTAPEMINPTR